MVLDYNASKAGVDTMDQMVRTYTSKRMTRRWPMVLFYNLLDVSALNAFIIWIHLNPNWMNGILYKRRIFLTELGKQLVKDNAVRRAVKSPISSSPSSAGANPAGRKRGRCVLCPRSKDVKHNMTCSKCHSFVCKDHLACYNCQNNWNQKISIMSSNDWYCWGLLGSQAERRHLIPMGKPKIRPPTESKPLIWLRWNLAQLISCKAVHGGLLGKWVKYTPKIFIYIYLFFRNSPTGQTPGWILARDGSNDAVSRKGVPFGG